MNQRLEDKVRDIYKRKDKLLWYIKLARTFYILTCMNYTDEINHELIEYINNLDIRTELHILEEYFIKMWKKMPMIKGTENDTIDEIFIKCFRLKWT